MGNLIARLAVFSRLLRPTRGVHASAFGWFRNLHTELANRRRARRVRCCTEALPTVAETSPSESDPRESQPLVPSPRKPADALPRTALSAAVPVVNPANVAEPAALARGHLIAHERRQAQQRAGRDRLSMAVLAEIARATSWETATEGAA